MRTGLVLLFVSVFAAAQTRPVTVVIETSLGAIDAEIDTVHAPLTAANFLKYVDAGYYNGGQFHRTVKPDNQPNNPVKIEVVQAGVKNGTVDFPPIPLERTSVTGLLHLDGTISMARNGPDSATSDFFICIRDQPSLDFGGKRNPDGQGFAAFGTVVRGMDVVRKIQAAPAQEQVLTPPVRILKISRK
jgi:peptidyl-prolyl cis-trans isomerase A (cyclophilin A)